LLRPEHGNINAASEYAAGAGGNAQAALQIAGLLTLYFKAHGDHALALRLCDRALSISPSLRTRERAQAQSCRGVTAFYSSNSVTDVALLAAVSIAREVGDEWTEAFSSGHLALWWFNLGQMREALEQLATIERLVKVHDDDLLRGLSGLARGWMYLAQDETEKALDVLRSVRHLSADAHQHHFIGVYIGLALFRRGEFAGAAAEWHEAMRNAIAVRHLRGIAGSVEGCGYIAERLGDPEQACRFLSAAEQIRQRAQAPLFSFWLRHNESANARLLSIMGSQRYAAAFSAGARMHTEIVINEAAEQLRQFATMSTA